MTLYMIGLGLYDEKDITLRGLETIKQCEYVYLEHYTSILQTSVESLEHLYGKTIILADRESVEQQSETMLEHAKTKDVAFLVVGDPMCATTHTDLFLRAHEQNITIKIIHNASIINAVGATGLEVYKFGKTTSITFEDQGWLPETPYNVIKNNSENNLHTLCLLDIKVKEAKKEDILKDKDAYLEPRYMTIKQALEILLKLEDKKQEHIISKDTLVIGIARIGADDQLIKSGTVEELMNKEFGKPLHSLIVPAKNLHFIEEDMLNIFKA